MPNEDPNLYTKDLCGVCPCCVLHNVAKQGLTEMGNVQALKKEVKLHGLQRQLLSTMGTKMSSLSQEVGGLVTRFVGALLGASRGCFRLQSSLPPQPTFEI